MILFSYFSLILICCYHFFFFFFQAEDGIRDADVTGVQTCALPISKWPAFETKNTSSILILAVLGALRIKIDDVFFVSNAGHFDRGVIHALLLRSEERRVGKEGRSRWSPYH